MNIAAANRSLGCNIAACAAGSNESSRWASSNASTARTGTSRWAPSPTCSPRRAAAQAPAILFDNVPGYPKGFRTLYGQLSSIRRIALTLGLPLEHDRKVDIVQRYHERMQDLKPMPPRFVKDGPILRERARRRRRSTC